MNFSVYSLFSGSSANATLIRAGDDAILIDAGGSLRRIRAAMEAVGCPMDGLRAVFVTHEHSDHIAALPMMAKYRKIPIHIVRGSYFAAGKSLSEIDPALMVLHEPLFEERIGPLTVRSFPTSHDSAFSVGYTVSAGGLRFGLATDTGTVTDGIRSSLSGCDLAVIEANHDPGMLRTGPYPPDLKARIRSDRGHLSNGQSAELAAELVRSGTKALLLAHLSAENNTPQRALDAVVGRLESDGLSATVTVAARCEITPLAVDWQTDGRADGPAGEGSLQSAQTSLPEGGPVGLFAKGLVC